MAQFQTIYIEEGNTVREVQPQIDYEEYRLRREAEEKRRRNAARRRKQVQARKRKLNSIFMVSTMVMAMLFFVGYVYMQSSITASANNIASLESEISTLKAENNAAESRLSTGGNLTQIRNTAVNDLGMVYANADQIVYYDMETSDYMTQYKDV